MIQDQQVLPDLLDLLEHQVQLDRQEHQGLLDHLEHPDPLVNLVLADHLEHPVPPDPAEAMETDIIHNRQTT